MCRVLHWQFLREFPSDASGSRASRGSMVKMRMSSLDVRAMVLSLQQTVLGYRVSNVYDINPRTYLLKLAKPDAKLMLLIESGIRVHTTEFVRDKGATPSVFTVKLRKQLKQKRIEKVEQLGSDRVIVLTCGAGEWESHVIIELYDKGNVVLTDPQHLILSLLRNAKYDADSKLSVGDSYPIARYEEAAPLDASSLLAAMQAADGGTTARQLVNRLLALGKEATEHALIVADFPPNTKMSAKPWESDAGLVGRLESAMKGALALLDSVASAPGGIIVLKRADAAGAAPAAAATGPDAETTEAYDEFAPFEMAQHRDRSVRRYESFSAAVDMFYSQLEVQRAQAEHAAQEGAAWKKVAKIKSAQEGRVGDLVAQEEADARKAALLEAQAEEVDALLGLLRNGVTSGMDWRALEDLIDESAKGGDELASMVHSLDLKNGRVTLVMCDEDDEDTSEEALTREATLVRVDLHQSALANARSFYQQKKAAAVKTAKTKSQAEAAVKAAEKKAAATVQSIKVKAGIRTMRKPFWWEKFDWFVSSENFLVVSAKDAQQAEMLVARHLRARDVYVHADLNGAPVCVVKHHGQSPEIPPLTLSQAGCAVLSRSEGWNNRVVTSAWWAPAAAITKADSHGGILPTGVFGLRHGYQRSYLPPSPPVMGFGVLFRVGLPHVAKHLDERRIRGGINDSGNGDTAAEEAAAGEEIAQDEEAEEAAEEGLDDEENDDDDDEEEGGTTLRLLPGGVLRVTSRPAGTSETHKDGASAAAPATAPAAASVDPQEGANAIVDISHESEASLPADHAADGGADESGDGGDGDAGQGIGDAMMSKPNRLTAKQRRLMKKGRLVVTDSGPEAVPGALDGSARDGDEEAEEDNAEDGTESMASTRSACSAATSSRSSSQAAPVAPTRGQKSKLKKMKGKYAEQDDEDRAMYLELLGSAGKSKRQIKAEEAAKEAAAKHAEAEARKARQAARQQRQREKEAQREMHRSGDSSARSGGDGSESHRGGRKAHAGEEPAADGDEEGDGEKDEEEESIDIEAFTELEALLSEPSMAEVAEARRAALCPQDTLTAQPSVDDELMYALPVCAPYTVLANYAYKLKLTPGSQKKGKAARQAIGILSGLAAGTKEKDLMRAVTDDELVRVMIGNVKIQAPAKLLQAQKSAEKKERKQAAKDAEKKASGGGDNDNAD